jgi:hypothetical protein
LKPQAKRRKGRQLDECAPVRRSSDSFLFMKAQVERGYKGANFLKGSLEYPKAIYGFHNLSHPTNIENQASLTGSTKFSLVPENTKGNILNSKIRNCVKRDLFLEIDYNR